MPRGRPRKDKIDNIIDSIVNKNNEHLIEDEDMNLLPEDDNQDIDYPQYKEIQSIPERQSIPEKQEHIDELLASIPQNEGYYLKLYKEVAPSEYEYKLSFSDFSHWTDLEYEITNIIRMHTKRMPHKWGSGKYKIMTFKHGERGFQRPTITFLIDANEEPATTQEAGVQQKLVEMGEFIKQVKDVFAPVSPNSVSSSESVTKMIAESFKAGIDSARAMTPQQGSQNNMMDMAITMLTLLKEIGVITPHKPKKEDDMLETLLKLKEAGLVKLGNEDKDDMLSSVSKIMELTQALNPLMERNENTSTLTRLAEILAPKIPQVVENITSAVRSVSEVSKMKLAHRLDAVMPNSIPSQLEASPNSQKPSAAPFKQEEANQMHPIIKSIYDAVESNDVAFYDKLTVLMNSFVNPTALSSLVKGDMKIDDFLSYIAQATEQPFFASEKSRQYFTKYIAAQRGTEEDSPDEIIYANCKKCGEQYEYAGKKAFDNDNRICDVDVNGQSCMGEIEVLSTNKAGSA